jgi:hypothetical protein
MIGYKFFPPADKSQDDSMHIPVRLREDLEKVTGKTE